MGDTEVLQIDACISEQYRNLCQSARFIRDIDKKAAFENPDDLFPTIFRIPEEAPRVLHRGLEGNYGVLGPCNF